MTYRLILMRHAKSSWSDPDLPDHDRPLNNRGKRSAMALGDWLRSGGYLPAQILCSTALRARQTYAGLALGAAPPPVPTLYHAGPDTLLRVLQGAKGRCVLVIAHNLGMADFAKMIVSAPPDHDRFSDYPTGATLVADFDIPRWQDAGFGTAQVRDFIVPRELVR